MIHVYVIHPYRNQYCCSRSLLLCCALQLKLTLVAEELARDVDLLAANDNDLLAAQGLLGDNRSKTAKEVTLTINDNDLSYNKTVSLLILFQLHPLEKPDR